MHCVFKKKSLLPDRYHCSTVTNHALTKPRFLNTADSHMLSQKRASVLGFSWLRRCLNQRWMVLTSQSSCLDRPSNLFSSGCWKTADRSMSLQRSATVRAQTNRLNVDLTA